MTYKFLQGVLYSAGYFIQVKKIAMHVEFSEISIKGFGSMFLHFKTNLNNISNIRGPFL